MHIQLNAQQRDILIVLLEEDKFTTISEIAQKLYLSSRSVRYSLSKVNLWLENQDVSLITKRGLGIYLDITKLQKVQLRKKLDNQQKNEFYITPERRIRMMLLELILSQQKISIKDLTNKFGVSRTTIHNSIDQISESIKHLHLQLRKNNNRGLFISGDEEIIRLFLAELLLEEIRFSILKDAWIKENKIDSPYYLLETTKIFLQSLDFKFGKTMILNLERGLGTEFTLTSRFFMVLFIAITIRRIQDGFTCRTNTSTKIYIQDHLAIINFLEKNLRQKLNQNFPDIESQIILITSLCLEPKDVLGDFKHPTYENFILLAQEVISEVAFYLHPSLKLDTLLEKDLTNYCSILYFRLKIGYPLKAPDIRKIQSLFPDIFKIAVQARKTIRENFDLSIPYSEAGNLALIFSAALSRLQGLEISSINCLVVCEEPLPTRLHLLSQLRAEFPNLVLTEADNDPDIFTKQVRNVSIVISTSLIDIFEKPVIQVNAIPSQSDIEAIRKWLLTKLNEKNNYRLPASDKKSILDILDESFITTIQKVNSWQDTIPLVGQPLINSGRISRNYLVAVENVIDNYGPFCHVGPGIILLHAKPSDGVFKLSMGLLLLNEGINFGNKLFDPVDLIFLLAAADNYSHIFALGQLIALTKNHNFLKEIRTSRIKKEIRSIIWKYSHSETKHLMS